MPVTIIPTLLRYKNGDQFVSADCLKGETGDTPVITAEKVGKQTSVMVNGAVIATILDGEDGDPGHSPVVTASKSGKVTTISVDGTPIATINDGLDGDPTALIDDTAGSGITGKTWSADKIAAEKSSLVEEINSKADASDVTELGEKVDRKADEPTGTKSTGKVYGLDINLNPAWVEKDTDPSVIAEATAEWLDDHPEATTTVEDGSITMQKLNSSVKDTIGINEYDARGYNGNYNGQQTVRVFGNTFTGETVKLYDGLQINYGIGNYAASYLRNGVTFTLDGEVLLINGTCNKTEHAYVSGQSLALKLPDEFLGKSVTVHAVTDKACYIPSAENNMRFELNKCADTSGTKLARIGGFNIGPIDNEKIDMTFSFTADAERPYIYFFIYYMQNGSVFDNVRLLFTIHETSAAVVDTEETIENGLYSDIEIPTGFTKISAGAHQIALENVQSTKEYIEKKTKAQTYDTVSALRNAEIKDGDVVSTLGYYSPNDGGNATYIVREKTGADVDDGGSILVIGQLVAELIADPKAKQNVKIFGAVGDGTNDDTQSIRNAIGFAKSVYIPSGTYIVSSNIEIPEEHSVEMEQDTIIKPNTDIIVFTMRSHTKLTGGNLYSYLLGANFSKSLILMKNNSSADYQNTTIRDVKLVGRKGYGTGIEIDSSASQVLYCTIDNVQSYGLHDVITAQSHEYVIGEFWVNLVANYAYRVITGEMFGSMIRITGEAGEENNYSDEAVYGRFGGCVFQNHMVDIGNPGHIGKGIHLTAGSTNNCVLGYTLQGQPIVDEGQMNFIQWEGAAKPTKFNTPLDYGFNNVLCNIYDRYSTSVELVNCTVSSDTGETYSVKKFIDTISDLTPNTIWRFSPVDTSSPISVSIIVEDININPTSFSYEWANVTGYATFGSAFTKVQIYGYKDDAWELIGENGVDSKERARYLSAGGAFTWQSSPNESIYKDYPGYIQDKEDLYMYHGMKIVFTSEKSDTYEQVGVITALTVTGLTDDRHQAFIRSDGSKVYGNVDFAEGKGVVLRSPNGTPYKLTVGDDGTVSAEIVS